MAKIRVNLANHAELMEIPGLAQADADAIVRFRNQHGPIRDVAELALQPGRRSSVGRRRKD